ncbi:MAG: GDP-mannose 4,6-dehydratase [Methanomicrobiales archaeon]|nr:GDP-mannose 4,6-dehydratase [Methanomicrobiales archaeon]MDD1646654.1 GDP-mannose 4,6-dehydratase [Methanomicrobiales archaeon]
MTVKKALVLGVTGQDGSYLAEILLEKGYEVHGMVRRSATGNTRNIDHLIGDPQIFNRRFFLCRGDLADPTSLHRIIASVRPDEIYNEADQDHVSWSYDMVAYSLDITGAAVGRLLEIIRQVDPGIRFFQPCSSNMFGLTDTATQNETTPFNPQSPYACAKVMAYYLVRYYRQVFGIHASTAIFYNHESPRRTPEYVTRKVTQSVARIASGRQDALVLGDLSSRIDWGYARDYMEAAWKILQMDRPDDFVIATGEAHSVKEWVDAAFSVAGLEPGRYVRTDPALIRPGKTSTLVGDITKARRTFGFEPKYRFRDLVRLMVEADLAAEKQSESG